MKVTCPSCQSGLNIDDKKIPPGGARIKCPTCQNVFPVRPGAPAAASSPSGAVPLPGISAAAPQRQAWEDEATRVAEVPLPHGAATVPVSWQDERTRAVPLPPPAIPGTTMGVAPPSNVKAPALPTAKAAAGVTVPLPGLSAAAPQRQAWEDEATRVGDVPLPGGSEAPAATDIDFGSFDAPPTGKAPALGFDQGATSLEPAISLPGAAGPTSDQEATAAVPAFVPRSSPGGSIPLPGGAAAAAPPPLPKKPASSSSIPLPGGGGVATAPTGGGIPLPGGRGAPAASFGAEVPLPGSGDELEVDLGGATDAVALPGGGGFGGDDFGQAPAAVAPAQDFGFDPPAAPAGGAFDFDSAPAPAAAPGAFDFGSAPAPALSSGSGAFDFSAPPPPAPSSGSVPGAFDFGGPPAPAAPAPASSSSGAFDFGAPPPAAPAAAANLGFGEVDFGGGGSPGGASGDLEFDPSSSPKAAGEDLEADLSAPIPSSPSRAPGGPADGLEMLSFIDDTARDAGAQTEAATSVRRFHVKRRSGKTFGPFEEAVIVKMLEDGQLLGNEEVSLDAENWQPIGSEPTFQAIIAKLMEAPARTATAQGLPSVEDKPKGPSMDRLKQLYEGRMAAVAVVQGKEPVPFKKRVPYLIAGVLLASVLVTGLVLGTTPYGFFALKLLFPAKVKAGTREFGYLQEARAAFLTDTWKSYQAAKASAEQALAVKEYPEARAVWCQAVFYLERKYRKASPGELAQAHGELVNIVLLSDKHPEVLKAMAGAALQKKQADEAMGFISDAVARDDNDSEAHFLRAEAYLLKKQPAQAKAEYEAILKKDPKSARGLHALGALLASQGETDGAAGKFAEALEVAPAHVSSAVELAEIAILTRKDGARGAELLDKALADDVKGNLSAAETGKALALRAELKVLEGKLAEAVSPFEEALKVDPNNAFAQARLARALLELHLPEKAVPLFQKAVQSVPESLDYTEGYLSALILVGKMDEATRVVQAATARFPGNAMLSYLSGRVSDVLDNPKEAEEAYKGAIAADANIPDAYLYLSRLYVRFRRFQEARPQLEAGLEKAPDDPALRVGMGELAFHERDLSRAETEFKKAIELNPNSADAHLGLSRVSLERGKYELAAAQVEKALELNPRIVGGRLQRGMALWKLSRLDEAIKELEQAQADEPRNTQLIVTLGAVEFEKGDLNSASTHLNSALIAEPSHADANFYLARLKNSRQEHTQAIEAMKRALEMNGKNPLYRYWMGRVYADARKTDDAIAEWKLALEVDPKYADALQALGSVYQERNDFKRSIGYYEQALAADPARLEARAAIGDAQMKMEDWKGAIATYQRVLEADPDMKDGYFKLGQAYEESRQFPKAIDNYKKAIKQNPEDADAWLRLGWLYKDTKKIKEAVTSFTRYLELKPEAENKKEIDDEIHFLTKD